MHQEELEDSRVRVISGASNQASSNISPSVIKSIEPNQPVQQNAVPSSPLSIAMPSPAQNVWKTNTANTNPTLASQLSQLSIANDEKIEENANPVSARTDSSKSYSLVNQISPSNNSQVVNRSEPKKSTVIGHSAGASTNSSSSNSSLQSPNQGGKWKEYANGGAIVSQQPNGLAKVQIPESYVFSPVRKSFYLKSYEILLIDFLAGRLRIFDVEVNYCRDDVADCKDYE